MGEPIQECSCHLWITKHCTPLRETQVSRDDYARALVEPADQVKQQCATGLAKWQVPQLIEDHQIGMYESVGNLALLAGLLLQLQ